MLEYETEIGLDHPEVEKDPRIRNLGIFCVFQGLYHMILYLYMDRHLIFHTYLQHVQRRL